MYKLNIFSFNDTPIITTTHSQQDVLFIHIYKYTRLQYNSISTLSLLPGQHLRKASFQTVDYRLHWDNAGASHNEQPAAPNQKSVICHFVCYGNMFAVASHIYLKWISSVSSPMLMVECLALPC